MCDSIIKFTAPSVELTDFMCVMDERGGRWRRGRLTCWCRVRLHPVCGFRKDAITHTHTHAFFL